MSEVKPYSAEEAKKEQIEQMFDNIAHSYDFLNHFFTLGIDRGWRRKMIRMIAGSNPKKILDVATGTGDVAIMMAKMLKPEKITGLDLSAGMLAIGKEKIKKAALENTITLQQGDSEKLPFEEGAFDAVTVAFGVRNFEDLRKGLSEMHRVTRVGGEVAILEFSMPHNRIFNFLYKIYTKYLMPVIGKFTSGDKAAYSYLFESVQQFPHGQTFINILREVGFRESVARPLFGGVCTIYKSIK
ncbi:MAG TPA: bifunctional demethylmenaquinone methyltransferase/2-methoxy-6-polyprenyl-1,4-benzoquinol methylase UbiE [Saprospiraceae bacterium]|nr:bifunctional demethylmenaquinone methyltransferase/2-methoxy-6-polyprenyl-1,4-benzoquinol methylase UbiE [Saprospiraceae bacterium]WKZ63311.1 MAG: bifunctional demethylmenaquinone methyltransferase/2-methoxy-6-polyprenyl-1,4-benzoquinol methylase UbiE [Saprospiraceae bacterium]HMY84056.1 bifunctional demethylmenaquinone methyltransferase/2-methoxy-6-polyprenyl-1,4-benzoquinol methylase UbiE [Saprospiraceae bacterium]HMZ23688.1 bifunctional demethylmenaquinone methyltransferase/2-methoxy-6-pol